MKHARSVLLGWLHFLDEKRIDHCLMRTLAGVDVSLCDQAIEIAVSRRALPELPRLFYGYCLREQLQLVQCLHREEETWRFVLSWLDEQGAPHFLCIDIIGDYYQLGRRLLSSEQLQAMRIADVTSHPGEQVPVVAPPIEFMHRLLRCVDSQCCTRDEIERLRELWQKDAAGTANLLSRLWPEEGSGLIASAACERWDSMIDGLPRLRSTLRPRGSAAIGAKWRRAKRRALCVRQPTGLLVACLGPDGSGKRSLIESLSARPMPPFAQVYPMLMRPRLIRQALTNPTIKPRDEKPRGTFAVPIKLALFLADYWVGYWARMRPRMTRAGLVVSDRYYDDVLVDPRRYRLRRPYALARALVPWIPRPDLWLVLDAPIEVLKERQQELTDAESTRMRVEYRRVLRGKDNLVVLDASRPEVQVLNQARAALVKHLTQRTAQRLGLPQEIVRNPLTTRLLLFFSRHRIPVLGRFVRAVFNSDIECRLPADVHIPYPYGLVLHPAAVIGKKVTLMQQVTLGSSSTNPNVAPVLGDGVYIGAGARVIGDVRIGDRAVIGANAVITKDVPPGVTVVGANRVVPSSDLPPVRDRKISEFPYAHVRR